MTKEIELQLANVRTLIWGGICLGLPPIFNLSLYSLSRSGVMPMAAFNAMESNWQLLYRIVLPAMAIVESLTWFYRPFRDGTLQWWFFAGLRRSSHWRNRWLVVMLRVALFWLLLTASTRASLILVWGDSPYPLGGSTLSTAVQTSRFALATINSLFVCLFWVATAFLASMSLSCHRFEAGIVLMASFVASVVVAGNITAEPLAALGGAHTRLFVISRLEADYTRRLWVGNFSVLGATAMVAVAADRVYRRVRFSPQDRRP